MFNLTMYVKFNVLLSLAVTTCEPIQLLVPNRPWSRSRPSGCGAEVSGGICGTDGFYRPYRVHEADGNCFVALWHFEAIPYSAILEHL